MPQHSVSLTSMQEAEIRELVETGVYANASEVIRDGMRALRRERELHAAHVAYLRGAWDEAMASGDAVPLDPASDIAAILETIEDRRARA